MPTTVSASEAKRNLGALVSRVVSDGEDVIVENHGKPTVAIISMEDYEKLKVFREQQRRQQLLEQLRTLQASVSARNQDLTAEEADALANRFSHELIEDMIAEGKIRYGAE